MRKLIVFILAFCIALSLIACNKNNTIDNKDFNDVKDNVSSANKDKTDVPSQDANQNPSIIPPESSNPQNTAHTHKYNAKIITEPTCVLKGVKTYTCSCGATYSEEVYAEHKWGEPVTIKNPTIVAEGVSQKICAVCGVTTKSKIDRLPRQNPNNVTVTEEQLEKIRNTYLDILNRQRKSNYNGPVTRNSYLEEIAQTRSEEIFEVFSHTRPDGQSCFTVVDLQRYRHTAYCETICKVTPIISDPFVDSDRWVGSDSQITDICYQISNELIKDSDFILDSSHKDAGMGICYVEDETLPIPVFYVVFIAAAK